MKTGRQATIWSIRLVFLLFLFFPLYILLKTALSAPEDVFVPRPPYGIHNPTLEHVSRVLGSGEAFMGPLVKSLLTALGTAFFSLALAAPAAYAIARYSERTRYLLLMLVFATRMIPEVSVALPISLTLLRLGLFDTVAGLVPAHLVRALPVACFILTGVFGAVPRELEQQARMDGAGPARTFFNVVLPLSAGGLAVTGIFTFLLSWDEFVYASYLCLAHPTLPLKMYYFVARGDLFTSATYALLITLPVLILTMAVQKYLKAGYFSGSMKG